MIVKELDTIDRAFLCLIILCAGLVSFMCGTIYTNAQIRALKNPPCPTCGK